MFNSHRWLKLPATLKICKFRKDSNSLFHNGRYYSRHTGRLYIPIGRVAPCIPVWIEDFKAKTSEIKANFAGSEK